MIKLHKKSKTSEKQQEDPDGEILYTQLSTNSEW